MLVTKFPQYDYTIVVNLVTDVANAAEVRAQLLAGNAEYDFAFISAPTVASEEHLLVAIYRAVHDTVNGHLRTKTIHSEAVFCMSPNNNIMDALKRFGISDTSTDLYAVKLIPGTASKAQLDETRQFLKTHVQGNVQDLVDDERIKSLTDAAVVQKNYKTTDSTAIVASISLRGH